MNIVYRILASIFMAIALVFLTPAALLTAAALGEFREAVEATPAAIASFFSDIWDR